MSARRRAGGRAPSGRELLERERRSVDAVDVAEIAAVEPEPAEHDRVVAMPRRGRQIALRRELAVDHGPFTVIQRPQVAQRADAGRLARVEREPAIRGQPAGMEAAHHRLLAVGVSSVHRPA